MQVNGAPVSGTPFEWPDRIGEKSQSKTTLEAQCEPVDRDGAAGGI
jgi:hypothetical protein